MLVRRPSKEAAGSQNGSPIDGVKPRWRLPPAKNVRNSKVQAFCSRFVRPSFGPVQIERFQWIVAAQGGRIAKRS